jgi:phage gp46-like protein
MIKLQWSPNDFSADIATSGNIITDEGLATSIIISLCTDQLADDTRTDKRGWWGDAYAETDGDKIGSRIWMLQRSAINSKLLSQVETVAKDSLQWMLEDGVASKIDAKALRFGNETVVLRLDIYKPDGNVFHYETSWRALANGI